MRNNKKENNSNIDENMSKMNINWFPRTYGKNKKTNYRRYENN